MNGMEALLIEFESMDTLAFCLIFLQIVIGIVNTIAGFVKSKKVKKARAAMEARITAAAVAEITSLEKRIAESVIAGIKASESQILLTVKTDSYGIIASKQDKENIALKNGKQDKENIAFTIQNALENGNGVVQGTFNKILKKLENAKQDKENIALVVPGIFNKNSGELIEEVKYETKKKE